MLAEDMPDSLSGEGDPHDSVRSASAWSGHMEAHAKGHGEEEAIRSTADVRRSDGSVRRSDGLNSSACRRAATEDMWSGSRIWSELVFLIWKEEEEERVRDPRGKVWATELGGANGGPWHSPGLVL